VQFEKTSNIRSQDSASQIRARELHTIIARTLKRNPGFPPAAPSTTLHKHKHTSLPTLTHSTTMSLPVESATVQRLPAIRDANLALVRAFEAHPAYPSQSTQRGGKIFFMWDFASRTNAMFESILQNTPPPDTPATRDSVPNVSPASMSEGQRKELVGDAVGRCVM